MSQEYIGVVNEILRTLPLDEFEIMLVRQWLEQTQTLEVKYFLTREDLTQQIVSFALISKMLVDPAKLLEDPWCLNFIYTHPKHRRQGNASSLMKNLKKFQMACCPLDSHGRFFTKNGFRNVRVSFDDIDTDIAYFPPSNSH